MCVATVNCTNSDHSDSYQTTQREIVTTWIKINGEWYDVNNIPNDIDTSNIDIVNAETSMTIEVFEVN